MILEFGGLCLTIVLFPQRDAALRGPLNRARGPRAA